MGVSDGRCSSQGTGRGWRLFWRAMGSHFRFEGWLTKSNVHFKNIFLLRMSMEAGLVELRVDAGRSRSSCKSVQKIKVTQTCAVAVSM